MNQFRIVLTLAYTVLIGEAAVLNYIYLVYF